MPVSSVARPKGHPVYSETMPCTPESTGTARRLIRTALGAWGLEHLAEDGALVVTELVANAAQHTNGNLIRNAEREGVVTDVQGGRCLFRHLAGPGEWTADSAEQLAVTVPLESGASR